MNRLAVVGMACRYPDAASPQELWENAIAGRRAFRRLPAERMNLDDYYDPDPAAPDRFYARTAAVIEGYSFDRIGFKVAGSTYRSTDLTHWLALETASAALADAGFDGGAGLPRERTGVIVGNTLTGEFTRANVMRLRWPYVRRTVAAALRGQDWDDGRLAGFLDELEVIYKGSFPAIDEDTLAGGLANTIAGRICNYYDLNGGGYTVDGACSSSLLSVVTAGKALLDGDLDVAIAGGVDLSIDPFEIVGFAKTGALARRDMRVYDARSNGFWPGEGCGMVVLMRADEAVAAGHRVYATIAGWGVSSDGHGGITRPEVGGYRLALQRAYARAGFGIETVGLFEGHGTGTAVGDTTELSALSGELADAGADGEPVAIGSVKGMIGHTKAAAGVAGLIKAALAVHHEMVPPSLGSVEPHELLTRPDARLRVLSRAEVWPAGREVRAGITAMGFGGINTHVVLENAAPRRRTPNTRLQALAAGRQDAELLAVDADTAEALADRLAELIAFVPAVSYAQLGDLGVTLRQELADRPYRAAVTVTSPEDAEQLLTQAHDAVRSGVTRLMESDGRCLLGHVTAPGRITFLFPGQGSGRGTSGGALRRRFTEAEDVYRRAALPANADAVATEVAQPRIVTGSAAGGRVLAALGITASAAVGHSLGEISALHWAGALDEETVLRVAAVRGRTMAAHSASGTMASVNAAAGEVAALIGDRPVVIAAYNGPENTVVAGAVADVEAFCEHARRSGHTATRLAVSHAFHSRLVAPAAAAFGAALAVERFAAPAGRVISTVTGEGLSPGADLPALLHRQITDPVLFTQAVTVAAARTDLFVEVGPGRVLTGLAAAATGVPAVALDTDSESLMGLLRVVAAAYVIGAAPISEALFAGRLVRPLAVGAEFSFLASPCELAPGLALESPAAATVTAAPAEAPVAAGAAEGESVEETLRRLTAERAELPMELVDPDSRLLDDLHLSSITVGQVVNQLAQQLGIPPAQAPANFAVATVRELAGTLADLAASTQDRDLNAPEEIGGVAAWSRPWRVDLDVRPLPARGPVEENAEWQVFAEPDHPFAGPLAEALGRGGVGGGVLVCLPPDCAEETLQLALDGARAAIGRPDTRFVLAGNGRGAAGLAKTLHLETPGLRTTIVHLPADVDAVTRVVAEVAATTGFAEALYDDDGVRRVPVLRAMPAGVTEPAPSLTGQDVLLVTGGGKGITAECALAVATDSGAALALLGRSDPAEDAELEANLKRIAAAGVRVRYARADVTEPDTVRRAVAELTDALGPVTAVLHGAGRNEPASLAGLDLATFRRTIAPKVDGLRAVLDAVDPGRLRLLITLGSVIGRAGLRGEAHYAVANDWLADETVAFGEKVPGCRVVCLEWSVWSGVGMGEKLSVVESLSREGITPVTPDQGIAILRRLLADAATPPVTVITGRTQGVGTILYDLPELPLLRFLERPLVRYHGVELVVEAELNAGIDLYLADHELDGNLLFPAVFGMEAMAQAAAAVTGSTGLPVIEDAEFRRPIVVPPHGSTRIRVAALVTGDDTVDVAIRSEETGYAADHFTARLRWGVPTVPGGPPDLAPEGLPPVPIRPSDDLYGSILFQGARFQRLTGYRRAAARDVDASVAAGPAADWFAAFMPAGLLLGDPGVRDALMHGNQVCVPDGTLLPAGVRRIHPGGSRISGDLRYCATERSREGDTYTYDIVLRDASGAAVERWEGLRLRAVRKSDGSGPWPAPLLGPYLERALEDVTGAAVTVAVEPDDPSLERRERSAVAVGRALGRRVELGHRPDGRPEVTGAGPVSVAHGAGLTLAVATTTGALGCDLEAVLARSEKVWADLLGPHAGLPRLIAGEDGEPFDVAATRVWTAVECLQKAGLAVRSPLTLRPCDRPGWTLLAAGDVRVATFATTVRGVPGSVVFTVLVESGR